MQSTSSSTRTFISPPPAVEKAPSNKRRKLKLRVTKRNLPWLIVAVLLLAAVFLLFEYHQAQNKLNSSGPQYYAQVTKKLGKLIILPTKETPTIVTVKDASKARSQAFYANSQDGDITFVYAKAHQAILYRPSANIIVNVAPVNLTASGSSSPTSH